MDEIRYTLEYFFDKEMERNPQMPYLVLCSVIQESGMKPKEVREAFYQFVPEGQYEEEEIPELLKFLYKVAKVK